MKIILDKERPMSWNKFYSGMFWRTRKTEADRVHRLVSFLTLGQKPVEGLVDITFTAYFDKRPYDSDNLPAKLYIDGLRKHILRNDTNKFVRRVTAESKQDKHAPRVEIEIKVVTK